MAPVTTSDDPSLLQYRHPRVDDGATLWELARSNGLDENSPYAYLLWSEYFRDTTVVAVDAHDAPVAFVIAFARPDEPSTVFVWQIGVAETHRRRGIAGSLLDRLADWTGADHVEATVTPTNTASETLFRRFGARHDAPVETDPLFHEAHFPPGHEAEVRFRIGPISAGDSPR